MKIRLARDEDYAVLARLHRQTIRTINAKDHTKEEIKAWSSRTTAKRFRDNAHKCKRWIAIEKEKVVGFCDYPLDECKIWGLYVHKDYLGHGVGSKLLQTAEKSLKKRGCKILRLQASLTAKDFYKKQGYKLLKKDFHIINDMPIPVYNMSKKIN